jgi:hypothetical protein
MAALLLPEWRDQARARVLVCLRELVSSCALLRALRCCVDGRAASQRLAVERALFVVS